MSEYAVLTEQFSRTATSVTRSNFGVVMRDLSWQEKRQWGMNLTIGLESLGCVLLSGAARFQITPDGAVWPLRWTIHLQAKLVRSGL